MNSTILAKVFQYNEGYAYKFRGCLSEIENNLSLLHQFQWIDVY